MISRHASTSSAPIISSAKEYEAKGRDAARYERIAVLQEPLTALRRQEFSRRKAQLALWEYLEAHGGSVSFQTLKDAGKTTATVQKLAAAGIVSVQQRRVLRDSYAAIDSTQEARTLTEEQAAAVRAVAPCIEQHKYQGFLLYGVTGSGKTQVYIELARLVRRAGRQVIVLVPEIALTGQLVLAFKAYFRQDIIVMHSRLTLAERNDAVHRVRRGEAGVIIGARSALFTPAEQVGLIILDEEQDMSYKQDESPRYHARVVAEAFARFQRAVLVLGSATPSLETYHRARTGELTLLAMPHRVGAVPLPEVACVDMRQELRLGNRHIISRPLEALIRQTLAAHEQIIIMLNRRGYSTFVMCRSCGEVIKCPDCGLPLVYHQRRAPQGGAPRGLLLCHHCDIRQSVPDTCPKCGSRYINISAQARRSWSRSCARSSPRRASSAWIAIRQARNSRIRTSFAASARENTISCSARKWSPKGMTSRASPAVGIISADASLNMPDFRAAERCFMLITQTAGRAGRRVRGARRGKVLVQTYNTEHYAVQCGIRQDYAGFYAQEIQLRRALGYPPFTRLIKLLFQAESEAAAREQAAAFVAACRQEFGAPADGDAAARAEVIGPAPALVAKFRGTYRFVVLIKAHDLAAVQTYLRSCRLHLRTDVAIDIDPITMM
jgi:primosomal protein N' (replication factor Y) (superfamily II helicase)